MSDENPKRVKGDCPSCGKDRWAHVHGERQISWDDDDNPIWTRDTYRLLECAGCEKIYYQHISVFSEDYEHKGPHGELVYVPTTVYFPSLSKRDRPDWLSVMPRHIDGGDMVALFDSLYTAIDHDLLVLAASGIRTVFDLAIAEIGIDPAITFAEKIEALKAQGRIGQYEQDDITTMVDAASAAMHRGWQPSLEELDTMMTTLERFIHHTFMLKERAAQLREKVPPKQRRKSAGV